MTEQENILDHLDDVFRIAEAGMNGMTGSPIHQFQLQSIEALKRVNFPDKKHEDWKYTPVSKLLASKYKLASHFPSCDVPVIPGLDSYVITILNGKVLINAIDPYLKKLGLELVPMPLALDNILWREAFNEWVTSAPTANRAFELLNFSFNTSGFFLIIPKNTVLDKPIEIRIIHDNPELSFSHPLYFIRCGESSQVEIIERFESNTKSSFQGVEGLINSLCYLYLEPNSVVKHIKWQDLPLTQHLVYKIFVSQQRDSHFNTLAFDHGGKIVRNNVEVELEGQNTYTSLQGGFLASGQQGMDHQTRINHKTAHCESHELYKGIIDDQATGAFNGKVLVHKDAQKTNAFQQNDTLVLSKYALMNSKPQLEIFADDVKCSHGATIGQLDEKALFYLKSRGLPTEVARHMLKKAFISEVLDQVTEDRMKSYISSKMGIGE